MNNQTFKKSSGFTLVEILVTLSIAAIMMTVILFSYKAYNDNLILSAAGQEMAIAIRQAQSYGLSVKQVSGTGSFNTNYGISFSLSNPTSYYIFADNNGNGKYDGDANCSAGTECVEEETLRNGVAISSFCSTDSSGKEICPAPGGVSSISVLFKRPNTSVYIYTFNSQGSIVSSSYNSIRVILETSSGVQTSVSVNEIGQVFIK
jgi:prepilin-type N-terminal cleavage/methylation domain-containing protein